MRFEFVLFFVVFVCVRGTGAVTCAAGQGVLVDGGCKCTWPYVCDHELCEIGGERCNVVYPKNGSLTPSAHICSGNGVYSRSLGRCMCNAGWETVATETEFGKFECNIQSWGDVPNPWAGSFTMRKESSCDCSMRWVEYDHKTISYRVGETQRMWGISSELMNASSRTDASRLAKQLCYLHFDCDAVTVYYSSSDDLYVVKYWRYVGVSTKDSVMDSGTTPLTTTYVIWRYNYADCPDPSTVDKDHLYSVLSSSPYHGTHGLSETEQKNWLYARFYEYFHRHPEYVTPNSQCNRGQPRTGETCEIPLCPPFTKNVNESFEEPCSNSGYCVTPSVKNMLATSPLMKTTCECSASYYFEPEPGSQGVSYCQASNAGLCTASTSGCAKGLCCSGNGECVGHYDAVLGEMDLSCDCSEGSIYGGKFCGTPKCNNGSLLTSCVTSGFGVCRPSSDTKDDEYQCICKNGHFSSGRYWDVTKRGAASVDETDLNCGSTLPATGNGRYMCYETNKPEALECNGLGTCVFVNCTEFTHGECGDLQQACYWHYLDNECKSFWPTPSEVHSCACFDSSRTGSQLYKHGDDVSSNPPRHCLVSTCAACSVGNGFCSQSSTDLVSSSCTCYKDENGYPMFTGAACGVAAFNESQCDAVFSHASHPPTLTCETCIPSSLFGPYCNLTCPTPTGGGGVCDMHNCGPSRTGTCLITGSTPPTVNATSCSCPCFPTVSSENYGKESSEGFCENPCVTGVWGVVEIVQEEEVYGCKCEFETGHEWAGKDNGYSGSTCSVKKCLNGGAWSYAVHVSGACECVDGWSGDTCASCSPGYFPNAGHTNCSACPVCQNGGTCVTDTSKGLQGTCACPDAFVGELCETSACANTSGGNCNGTWSNGCVRRDPTTTLPVCDCKVWASGEVHFGGNLFSDCDISYNASLCHNHGYTEGPLHSQGVYSCFCDEGYFSNDCSKYNDTGTCGDHEAWDVNTGECECLFNWSGPSCNVNCKAQYCNNATDLCLDDPYSPTDDPVTCVCPSYVTSGGQQCHSLYRDVYCSGNGDKPAAGFQYSTCDCDAGFIQPTCSDTCRHGKCNGHGDCATGDQSVSAACVCDTDWYGDTCGLHKCSGNGVPVGDECQCHTGWAGDVCCEHVTSCNNRGTVVSVDGECLCSCDSGYVQPHCTDPDAGEAPTNHDVAGLTVRPSTVKSGYVHKSHLTWVIVGSSIGGALVVGLVIWGIVYAEKKRKEKKKVEGVVPKTPKKVGGWLGVLRRGSARHWKSNP